MGLDRRSSRCGGTYRLKCQPTMGFVPEHTALLVIDPVNDFLSEPTPIGTWRDALSRARCDGASQRDDRGGTAARHPLALRAHGVYADD